MEQSPITNFSQLHPTKKTADYVLVSADGQEFAVHRAIVKRACGTYFDPDDGEEMSDGPYSMPNVDTKTLEVFLLLMYGAKSDVPEHLLESVFAAADEYMFNGLKTHIEDLLISRLALETAAELLIVANTCNSYRISEIAIQIIKKNPQHFVAAGGLTVLETKGPQFLFQMVQSGLTNFDVLNCIHIEIFARDCSRYVYLLPQQRAAMSTSQLAAHRRERLRYPR